MRALNAFSHVEMMLFVLKHAPDRILKIKIVYDIEKSDFASIYRIWLESM